MNIFIEVFYFRFSSRKISFYPSLITDVNKKMLQNLAVFYLYSFIDKLNFFKYQYLPKIFKVKL